MKSPRPDAEVEIRRRWKLRPADKRSANDVLSFHGDLERDGLRPFPGIKGDSYQHLKVILSGLIERE